MQYSDFRNFVVSFLSAAASDRSGEIADVRDDEDMIEAGIVDSHTFLDLCLAIEERTGVLIDIPALEPAEFSTIRGLYAIATRQDA